MQLSPAGDDMITVLAKAPSEALLLEIAAKQFHSLEALETRKRLPRL